jgi:hypothetical protein
VREGGLQLVSPRARSEAEQQFAALQKIENRLELGDCDEPRAGFEPNWFGGFDRADLRRELLAGYEALVDRFPGVPDFRYRYAGALARAVRLDDARAVYAALVETMDSARLMLAMVQLAPGDEQAAADTLSAYNARCVEQGMPFMQSTLDKISLRRREHPET